MNTELYPCQIEALKKMHNGCILGGKVGTGKSRTALAYAYMCELGGSLRINGKGVYAAPELPKDIYIITPAKKRDTHEWEKEAAYFNLPNDDVNVIVDSWNNIKKYNNVYGAFFIFDEQRLVGKGTWVKSFYKIARKNHWILLSATPGDKYEQLVPILIANGFYKNRSQFELEHCVMVPYVKYKKIDHYTNTRRLDYYISQIIIPMQLEEENARHYIDILCNYDRDMYKKVFKDRWDPFENEPIEETGKLLYLLRRVSNDDYSRYYKTLEIVEEHEKVIIFYNFTYELVKLRELFEGHNYEIGEWNGERHTELPTGDRWVYLCQYTAACEGWNCITTDTIIFFSQNYSYKVFEQASGRTDRANTPYHDLYYYCLRSASPIDLAIRRALKQKQNFNEKIFLKRIGTNGN